MGILHPPEMVLFVQKTDKFFVSAIIGLLARGRPRGFMLAPFP